MDVEVDAERGQCKRKDIGRSPFVRNFQVSRIFLRVYFCVFFNVQRLIEVIDDFMRVEGAWSVGGGSVGWRECGWKVVVV